MSDNRRKLTPDGFWQLVNEIAPNRHKTATGLAMDRLCAQLENRLFGPTEEASGTGGELRGSASVDPLRSRLTRLEAVLTAARVITRQEGPENNGRYRIYDPGPIGTGEDTCRVSVPYAPWDALSEAIRLADTAGKGEV